MRSSVIALACVLASCTHAAPEASRSDVGVFMEGTKIDAVEVTPLGATVEFTLNNETASDICVYRDLLSGRSQLMGIYLRRDGGRVIRQEPVGFLMEQDHSLVVISPKESLRFSTSNLRHDPKYLLKPNNLSLAVVFLVTDCRGTHQTRLVRSEWVELS